jgi:starch phosphorylase
MARDYLNDMYGPAARFGRALGEGDAAGAVSLARWRDRVARNWSGVSARLTAPPSNAVRAGEAFTIEIDVEPNGLSAEDLRAECLLVTKVSPVGHEMRRAAEFRQIESVDPDTLRLQCNPFESGDLDSVSGLHEFRIRIYPHHPLLTHPFECGCMLWL